MNEISVIQCPQCSSKFKKVHRIEKHITEKHCKFCGRKEEVTGNLRTVNVLEEPDYESLRDRIESTIVNSKLSVEVNKYKGGFTPVLVQVLLEDPDEYIESEGPLTGQELLEYYELHRQRNKGKACESCRKKYKEIIE